MNNKTEKLWNKRSQEGTGASSSASFPDSNRFNQVLTEAHERYEQNRLLSNLTRVEQNLHQFLHPDTVLSSEVKQVLMRHIDLSFDDLNLIKTYKQKVERIINTTVTDPSLLQELKTWVQENPRALELSTAKGELFSSIPDLQRYVSLLLSSDADTAKGLMSHDGALVQAALRVNANKTSLQKPEEIRQSSEFRKRITQQLARLVLAGLPTFLLACSSSQAISPIETQEPAVTSEIANEAEEGEEEREVELFNPQDFDYQSISAGGMQVMTPSQEGLEIVPVPTSVTPNNQEEQIELNQMIEMLEPVLVELLSQKRWRENTSIAGVLLRIDGENKVAVKINGGGSSDQEFNQGDVIYLNKAGDGYTLELYRDERTAEEVSLDHIKDQLEVINGDLQGGKVVLSQEQEKQQLYYQVDGQKIAIGELITNNNTPLIHREGTTYQLGALTAIDGELVITTGSGEFIKIYEKQAEEIINQEEVNQVEVKEETAGEESGEEVREVEEEASLLELGPVEEYEIFDHSRFKTAYEGTSSDGLRIRLAYDENQQTLSGKPFFPFPVEIGYVDGTDADGEPIINNDAFADILVNWLEYVRDGKSFNVIDASILKRLIAEHKSPDSLINTLSDPDILKSFELSFRPTDNNGNPILNNQGEPIKVIDELVLYYQGAEHNTGFKVPPEYRQFEVLSEGRDDLMISASVGRGTSDVPANFLLSLIEKPNGDITLLIKCFLGSQQQTVDRPNSELAKNILNYHLVLALLNGINTGTWPPSYTKTSGNSLLGGRTHVVHPDSIKSDGSRLLNLLSQEVHDPIVVEGILINLAE